MAHIKDMPELAKRQRQERHRHRRLLIQLESEARKGKGSKCRDGQCDTVQYDREPLAVAENRLVRMARWPLQYVLVAFAHSEGKSREDVRYEVQKQGSGRSGNGSPEIIAIPTVRTSARLQDRR